MFEVDSSGNLHDSRIGLITFISKAYCNFGREPTPKEFFEYKIKNSIRHLKDSELEHYTKIILYQKYLKDDRFKICGKFTENEIINVRLYIDFHIPVFDRKTYNLILKKSRDISKMLKCNIESLHIDKKKKERKVRMYIEVSDIHPKKINRLVKFIKDTSALLMDKL